MCTNQKKCVYHPNAPLRDLHPLRRNVLCNTNSAQFLWVSTSKMEVRLRGPDQLGQDRHAPRLPIFSRSLVVFPRIFDARSGLHVCRCEFMIHTWLSSEGVERSAAGPHPTSHSDSPVYDTDPPWSDTTRTPCDAEDISIHTAVNNRAPCHLASQTFKQWPNAAPRERRACVYCVCKGRVNLSDLEHSRPNFCAHHERGRHSV